MQSDAVRESAPTKSDLRVRFRAFRASLEPEERAARSERLCTRLAGLPEVARAVTIHAYWPMEGSGEVDVRPLLRSLAGDGRRIVLPVVTSFERGRPAMAHRVFRGEARLRANRWGVEEPIDAEAVPDEAIDLVLVPALGAARDGHRLGHGRGYYDAFLARCAAPAVGAVYHPTLVDRLPVEPHDIPLDAVVTDEVVLRFPAARARRLRS